MEHDNTNTEMLDGRVARPFKRRKFYRKRANSPDDEESSVELPVISNSVPDENAQTSKLSDTEEHANVNSPLTVAEILRRRKAAQRRRGGIEFLNAGPVTENSAGEPRPGDEVLDNDDNLGKILTVVDRFAPSTGQVADVDKHMYTNPDVHRAGLKMQLLTM